MEWIYSMQKAIEYIEKHLVDDSEFLKQDRIAKEAASSEFNFQKMFSVITGLTVGEYIRNRRLALAGEELLLTDQKILEVALKYGYDTAESFTKAFTRFHGTTPKTVRKNSAKLKSYNRLKISFRVDGGESLDYYILRHDSFRVLAKTHIFEAKSIDENKSTIPEYLEKCGREGMYEFLYREMDNTTDFKDAVLGIHDTIGCKPDGSESRLCVGVEYRGTVASDGYEIVEVPAGRWIVFQCTGRRPESIQKLWYRIYTEFKDFTSCRVKDNLTIEVCREGFINTEDVISELWFPLE